MKVLVGEISSYKAIVLARYFKQNYKDVIVYTYGNEVFLDHIITKYSDYFFYINPYFFESELKAIIRDYEIDYFFPVINNSLTKLLNKRNNFGTSLDYIGDVKAYSILNNKFSLHKLAISLNIKVPKIFQSLEAATVPSVFKPTNLSSALGVKYIFKEKDKLKIRYHNIESFIIQDYIEGTGVGYSFYCKNGIINNGYGHKRLAEYPITGGSSTYRTEYQNDEMHTIASVIVKELRYTGFAMFEFKLTKNNELYLIEVNPRIWGSINQGLAENKINYFEEILGVATLQKNKKQKTVNTYISPLLFLSMFHYLIRFRFKIFFIFFSNIFKNKPDVSVFSDLKGYYSSILRKIW